MTSHEYMFDFLNTLSDNVMESVTDSVTEMLFASAVTKLLKKQKLQTSLQSRPMIDFVKAGPSAPVQLRVKNHTNQHVAAHFNIHNSEWIEYFELTPLEERKIDLPGGDLIILGLFARSDVGAQEEPLHWEKVVTESELDAKSFVIHHSIQVESKTVITRGNEHQVKDLIHSLVQNGLEEERTEIVISNLSKMSIRDLDVRFTLLKEDGLLFLEKSDVRQYIQYQNEEKAKRQEEERKRVEEKKRSNSLFPGLSYIPPRDNFMSSLMNARNSPIIFSWNSVSPDEDGIFRTTIDRIGPKDKESIILDGWIVKNYPEATIKLSIFIDGEETLFTVA